MISGSPRKKSVYAAASTRSGKNTGPRRVRAIAISMPRTRTATPQISSRRTFSHNPSRTFGSASRAYWALKNVSLVRGQPGASTTTR